DPVLDAALVRRAPALEQQGDAGRVEELDPGQVDLHLGHAVGAHRLGDGAVHDPAGGQVHLTRDREVDQVAGTFAGDRYFHHATEGNRTSSGALSTVPTG